MEAMMPVPGLTLMFMLGLQHGLDPDHIAMIDSMAYRSLEKRPRFAPWVGTLFALGHGLTVAAVAVALGTLAGGLAVPAVVRTVLNWLPTVLLLLVGSMNLRSLLLHEHYRPVGWKTRFLPARLRDSSHPFAVVLVGVVFALVFDTATQAAAWGYAAGSGTGAMTALLAGLVFTGGMVLTDTIDGRLMVRMMRHAAGHARRTLYRRRIGWSVVAISFATALYTILTHRWPALELSGAAFTGIGAVLVLGLLFASFSLARSQSLSTVPLAQE